MDETCTRTEKAAVPRVMTLGEDCIWSINSRAGGETSETAAAVAPAVSFGQPVGAGAGAGVGAAVITAVGTDVELADPAALWAVTTSLRVFPWSADLTEYSFPVAPVMPWHAPPVLLQMRHW